MKRPVEAPRGSRRLERAIFCGVHCTNLEPHEARLRSGAARAFACICATTERDLGDGLPDLGALRSSGARLCMGIDSHVVTWILSDDMRALETHEIAFARAPASRSRPEHTTPAEIQIWREG